MVGYLITHAVQDQKLMRAFFSNLAIAAGLALVAPGQASGQEIRGQVVDSVTGRPVPGGVVVLLTVDGTEQARVETDEVGRFLLYASGVDRYRLRAEHPEYRTSTFPEFELQPNRALSYILLLPSRALSGPLPQEPFDGRLADVCGTSIPGTPTIAGWIRHAGTEAPVREASISVSWANLPDALADQVSVSDYIGMVLADSSGFYAVCNAPLNTKISIHAMSADGVSDFHDIAFGDGAVVASGLAHFINGWVWQQDFNIFRMEEHNTVLTGTVTDGSTGDPVIGAEVELHGTVYGVRTDSAGRFHMEHLPAGPAKLVVRQIGRQPLRQEITLPEQGTLNLPPEILVLGRAAQMLDPLFIETTAAHSPLAEFNRRRRYNSVGAFLTREEWERQGNPVRTVDILRRMRGIRIDPGPDLEHAWVVSMRRANSRRFSFRAGGEGLTERDDATDISQLSKTACPPLIFLDRHYLGDANSVNVNTEIPFGDLLAVEAHGSTGSIPIEFNRRGAACGVIAFWTRHAAPETVAVDNDPGSLVGSTAFHFAVALGAVVAIFVGLGQSISF